MEAKAVLCKTALEVLDKDNYISWSVRVKTYLMAQDLWNVIEVATESPKDEDDEANRKAQSQKNFMALHVIQNSCGPEFFYEIRKISSAKTAWYKLAEIYNNMPKNANSVVHEDLRCDNYEHCSAQVKAYLMAHDLWDTVEATTEPPKQEDDESTFRTWRKNNFLALHVIQNSCGRPLFYTIKQDTLAKDAWNNLSKSCDVPRRRKSVIHDVLKKDPSEDDYDYWSIRIKTYLIAQDIWDTIQSSMKPPKQEDEVAWTKKNLMALQVIENSCDPDIRDEICQIALAKTAWDTLEEKYGGSRGFIRSINEGNWDALHRYLIRDNMTALNAKINDLDETPLHMAVTKGHVHIVEKLVALMSKEDLEIKDSSGMTAMARASALVGADTRMLKCMHEKNEKLVTIPDLKGRIPFQIAMEAGNGDAFGYLISVTPNVSEYIQCNML